MASADLRQELDCPICLSIYTDPVTLRCGHNFCRVCIDCVLDAEEELSGAYACPECRADFKKRPALQRNPLLWVRGEKFLHNTLPYKESTGIFCSYCIHPPVPAAKSCLQCEVSLCANHVGIHSKSAEHVLRDPTNQIGCMKNSVYWRMLQTYYTEEAGCVCMSCFLPFWVVSRRDRWESPRRHQGKVARVINRVAARFRDIRRKLQDSWRREA